MLNNIINLQVPDTSIPEIKDPGGSLPSDPDTPGGPDTPSDPDTPDLSKYALKTDIPTKLSQLDNDINATSLSTVYSGLDNIFKLKCLVLSLVRNSSTEHVILSVLPSILVLV